MFALWQASFLCLIARHDKNNFLFFQATQWLILETDVYIIIYGLFFYSAKYLYGRVGVCECEGWLYQIVKADWPFALLNILF